MSLNEEVGIHIVDLNLFGSEAKVGVVVIAGSNPDMIF